MAENEKDLRTQLAKQNLYLVKSKPDTDKSPNMFFSVSGKVTVSELATFCRQFAIMISSGTSIVDALNILKNQSYSDYLRKVLARVHEDVKAGAMLSDALGKHKKVFPNFLRSMVKVGEMSGAIDQVFVDAADYYENDARIRSKMRAALTYPLILILMAIGIIVLMVVFIIPTFQETLASLDVEMPALTLAIYDFSEFVRANWKEIILIVAAVIGLFYLFINTKRGRYLWDKLKFRMPVVNKVVQANVCSRFCRAFSLLIGSGMDIVDAMDEVVIVFGNAYVADQFKKATEDVRAGMTLTLALNSYKLFPMMLVQMVSVGERTGELESVLSRSCSFFDDQAERVVTSVTSIIQPVILAIIGASVGVLFIAVYSPLLNIMDTLDSSSTTTYGALRQTTTFICDTVCSLLM